LQTIASLKRGDILTIFAANEYKIAVIRIDDGVNLLHDPVEDLVIGWAIDLDEGLKKVIERMMEPRGHFVGQASDPIAGPLKLESCAINIDLGQIATEDHEGDHLLAGWLLKHLEASRLGRVPNRISWFSPP